MQKYKKVTNLFGVRLFLIFAAYNGAYETLIFIIDRRCVTFNGL